MLQTLEDCIYDNLPACPTCGAPATTFHKDGTYERDFICYENGNQTKEDANDNKLSGSQRNHRKSDILIVPKKLLITVEGRGMHFIASSKSKSCRRGS